MPSKPMAGLTFIELVVCTVMIGVLAVTALPISKNFIQSKKEDALKIALRDLREGIDRYREKQRRRFPDRPEEQLYPLKLEDLVTERVLRKVPNDPMVALREWGQRSSTDPLNASYSDGVNIFDVYSLSSGTAFDGTPYRDW